MEWIKLILAGLAGGVVSTGALLSLSYLAHYARRREDIAHEIKAETDDLLSSLERQGRYTTHNPRVSPAPPEEDDENAE